MQLKPYPKILSYNEMLAIKYKGDARTDKMKWVVTEFVDGLHLALYANFKTGYWRATTRKRLLENKEIYGAWENIAALNRQWIMNFSQSIKSPVIVYGKMIGGGYNNVSYGRPIKTCCEYMKYNEFFIHDIEVDGKLISQEQLFNIAKEFFVPTAPILYSGDFDKIRDYPNNRLSMIPFLHGLPVKYDNEMKGIVIRPVHNLHNGGHQMMLKKLNRKYIGKTEKAEKVELTDTLVDIAAYISNEAMLRHTMDAVVVKAGTFTDDMLPKLAGEYVKKALDKINYIKYNLLTNREKRLVHKELNRIALDLLNRTYKTGEAA